MNIVFLCGGLGSRLVPLSNKYPKSLIPINGKPLLEDTLSKIMEQLIPTVHPHIYIVASAEYFKRDDYSQMKDRILEKVSTLHEVVNPMDPDQYNNWVSMRLAFEVIDPTEGTLVIEGDVHVDESFLPHLNSTLLGADTSKCYCTYRENEWVILTDRDGKPTICKNSNGLALSGISYVTPRDHLNYLDNVEKISDNQTFWDEVFINNASRLDIIDVGQSIQDFDTIEELIEKNLLTPREIAELLSDDGECEELDSMTNTNFKITKNGSQCILRVPGYRTDEFIDRSREPHALSVVREMGITPASSIYSNGMKITEFIEGRTSTRQDMSTVLCLLAVLHRDSRNYMNTQMRTCNQNGRGLIDLISEVNSYEKFYEECNLEKYEEVSQFYRNIIIRDQHKDVVLCHRDLDPRNILIEEKSGAVYLVDFEYSGYLNRLWDLGCQLAELRIFYDYKADSTYDKCLEEYISICGIDNICKEDIELWTGVVDYVWSCWSVAKCTLGEDYHDYLAERWDNACEIYKKYSQNMR